MSESIAQNELQEKIAKLERKAQALGHQFLLNEQSEAELQKVADKVSLIADTEESLQQNFIKNMKVFADYFPDIYNTFIDYAPKRYHIDIVEGFVNIFDVQSQKHSYQYPSYLVDIFHVKNYQLNPTSTRLNFHIDGANQGKFTHVRHLNEIVKILNRREKENLEAKEQGVLKLKAPKVMKTLMIFGVGLGHHLDLLLGHHQVKSLYIIEPDLDLFYTSLFVTNWTEIIGKLDIQQCNLHISLGSQCADFFEEIQEKAYLSGQYEVAKTFGYIHDKSPEVLTLVNQYRQRYPEITQGWGFFDDGVISIAHLLENLYQSIPLLKKQSNIKNQLANTPVFIVANGPSLDGLIETIKKYQNKAIIISCGSTLSALYQYGIIPDIHCEQERTSPVADQIDCYCPKEVLSDILFAATATVHPSVFVKFKQNIMMLKDYEPGTTLARNNTFINENASCHKFINPTVANTALSLATELGFKNIFFLGVDLGHKLGENHHSKKSFYYDDKEDDLNLYQNTRNAEATLPGNFGGNFVSDNFFNRSRVMLEHLVKLSQGHEFYNLSDGVAIEGVKALTTDRISTFFSSIKLNNKKSQINELFTNAKLVMDHASIVKQYEQDLDFKGFEQLCSQLVQFTNTPINNTSNALDMLDKQVGTLRGPQSCQNFYLLLNGTMMQMFAMLLRILYESTCEKIALDDFIDGLEHYRKFLREAPKYYEKNSRVPHEMSSHFHNILKGKSKYNN